MWDQPKTIDGGFIKLKDQTVFVSGVFLISWE